MVTAITARSNPRMYCVQAYPQPAALATMRRRQAAQLPHTSSSAPQDALTGRAHEICFRNGPYIPICHGKRGHPLPNWNLIDSSFPFDKANMAKQTEIPFSYLHGLDSSASSACMFTYMFTIALLYSPPVSQERH